ncbi:hypothetical protein PHMEG_0003046 [Phytophthora megakarya]|uniref:Ubiquitin-like protease family profile domain-containing protein n=1 Tax=Phytophthora megakarya TaxID=4795 RepID=A0A225WZ49_9STRA|nr:hypothetical protein PHMEG_0003046 [Phytophthora megakarya]
MTVLPVANTNSCAISVDESASQEQNPEATIDTVYIKDIGTFSRKQVETFKRYQNLKKAIELGIAMHKRILEEDLTSLPAYYHFTANEVARDIVETAAELATLPDYKYTLLYRLTPPTWLTDVPLRACCERLVVDNMECRLACFQVASPMPKRTRTKNGAPVDVCLREKIMSLVQEANVDTIFLPVNFLNAHWCFLVIKTQSKRILFYDPLNQDPYKNASAEIATHLKVSGLQDYDMVAQNNLIQFDAFSCAVYVCWMFIRHSNRGLRVEIHATALPRRRFELFIYLKTTRLLTLDPATINWISG